MRDFPFSIETAEEQVFDGRVEMLCARALDGGLGVLAGHAPLVTALDAGIVRVRQGERERQFVVGESLLVVRPEGARILCEFATEAAGTADAHERLRELKQWYLGAESAATMM